MPYRYDRLLGMVGAALVIYGASVLVDTHSVWTAIAIKVPLMLLFPVALLASGLFYRKDLAAALAMLERRVPQSAVAVRYLRPIVLRGGDASGS